MAALLITKVRLEELLNLCRASYCEIYNEALYDLLNFTNQQLAIRWDAAKGFHVPELYVKECAEITDLLQVEKSLASARCMHFFRLRC